MRRNAGLPTKRECDANLFYYGEFFVSGTIPEGYSKKSDVPAEEWAAIKMREVIEKLEVVFPRAKIGLDWFSSFPFISMKLRGKGHFVICAFDTPIITNHKERCMEAIEYFENTLKGKIINVNNVNKSHIRKHVIRVVGE